MPGHERVLMRQVHAVAVNAPIFVELVVIAGSLAEGFQEPVAFAVGKRLGVLAHAHHEWVARQFGSVGAFDDNGHVLSSVEATVPTT